MTGRTCAERLPQRADGEQRCADERGDREEQRLHSGVAAGGRGFCADRLADCAAPDYSHTPMDEQTGYPVIPVQSCKVPPYLEA